MNDWEALEILQLLLEKQYINCGYKLYSNSDEKIEFISIYRDMIGIFINYSEKTVQIPNYLRLESLIGGIYPNGSLFELLSSASYIGCVIELPESNYYFNKHGIIYKLFITGNRQLIYYIDYPKSGTDINNIHSKFRVLRGIMLWEYDDFVNIILRTTNVKSARS